MSKLELIVYATGLVVFNVLLVKELATKQKRHFKRLKRRVNNKLISL